MDIMHEQLRMQVRLAYELGYFQFKDGKINEKSPDEQAFHRLTVLQEFIDEIGRMIGGWINFEQKE